MAAKSYSREYLVARCWTLHDPHDAIALLDDAARRVAVPIGSGYRLWVTDAGEYIVWENGADGCEEAYFCPSCGGVTGHEEDCAARRSVLDALDDKERALCSEKRKS